MSSYVFFQHYNEDGYQFTIPTNKVFWLHWDIWFRLDPVRLTYHKFDPLSESNGMVYLRKEFVQKAYDIT